MADAHIRVPGPPTGCHTLVVTVEIDDLALYGRQVDALAQDIGARTRLLAREAISKHRVKAGAA